MAASLRQLNPQKVQAIWLGLNLCDDVTPGTFLRLIKDNQRWIRRTAGKNSSRIMQTGRGARLEITIPRESDLNRKLVALALADEIAENIVGPLLISDPGGSEAVGNNAFLPGIPDGAMDYATGPIDVTWVLEIPELLEKPAGFALVTAGNA